MRKLLARYMDYCKYERGVGDKTLKAYHLDIKLFEKYIKSELDLTILTAEQEHLKQYLATITETNKPKTVKRKLISLRLFYTYLEDTEKIEKNPFYKLKIKVREGKQLPRVINKSILARLLQYLHDKRDLLNNDPKRYRQFIKEICIIEILFSTGMRVSEISNLQPKNISIPDELIDLQGKGGRQRRIPICGKATLDVISDYISEYKDELSTSTHFFTNRDNTRLSEQSIRNIVKRYSIESNINVNITPHIFRHTVATMLLENGVDIRFIQYFLGHSSIATTQIYAHVNEEAQRKIVSRCHPRGGFAG